MKLHAVQTAPSGMIGNQPWHLQHLLHGTVIPGLCEATRTATPWGHLAATVLGFSRKANEVKGEATEPCKIEGISMVLDSADSQRVSGQGTTVGQSTKEQVVSTN